MKKVLLLLIFIVFTGCVRHNVGVVGSKRMLISGNILNAENTPIENISVIASGSEYDRLWARPAQMLGESSTNASGEFSFVSLDTDNSFYGVSVNHPNHDDFREEFSTIHFLDSIGSRGNSFELTNIQLPKIQEFQVKLNNTSDRNDTLFFEFSYSSTEIYRKLHEDSFDNPLWFQGESEYWNRILPGEDEMTISAKTIEDSDLQFYYKFSAEAVYDTINVEITPENPVYEFSY
ncbi:MULTISPECIES: hypothetical protein [unclassified Salegentibacter]|jgi:hypothetical protein|uniref:hypothetical protein n=1 Tax=unclassified Salegentibacter TaxID=2633436 RepID=UPI00094A18DB|nr:MULTISPECIES: hypothetical protein [unclassified Salegentibacter]APS38231.1 hypothetical protein AO058_04725 [Salegentibacter sp. T436]